jgi:hypothetical protein
VGSKNEKAQGKRALVKVKTNDKGEYTSRVQWGQTAPPLDSNDVEKVLAQANDPHGTLRYDASRGLLNYTGGTVNQVSYHDMTVATTRSPGESIIGANLQITGMYFQGIDSTGAADFGGGTLTIFNSAGTFLSSPFDHEALFTDPLTHDSVLFGVADNVTLDFSQPSLYLRELQADLAKVPAPAFSLNLGADLGQATNLFTTDGEATALDCALGGGLERPLPEPSTLVLLSMGGLVLLCRARRTRAA